LQTHHKIKQNNTTVSFFYEILQTLRTNSVGLCFGESLHLFNIIVH
jgi:hypothetical protein